MLVLLAVSVGHQCTPTFPLSFRLKLRLMRVAGVLDASVFVLCISCIVYFHIVCTRACRQLAQDDAGVCMVCTHLGR